MKKKTFSELIEKCFNKPLLWGIRQQIPEAWLFWNYSRNGSVNRKYKTHKCKTIIHTAKMQYNSWTSVAIAETEMMSISMTASRTKTQQTFRTKIQAAKHKQKFDWRFAFNSRLNIFESQLEEELEMAKETIKIFYLSCYIELYRRMNSNL